MPKQTSASSSGFHFFNAYQCCQRKFFFRWIKGWVPRITPTPLVCGSAFHEGKATFYRTHSERKAIATLKKYIDDQAATLDLNENVEALKQKFERMLVNWVLTFGKYDLEDCDVVEVEVERHVILPGGFKYTGRPDTILRRKKDGVLQVMETKSAGFSLELTMDAVVYGDQSTSYLLLVPDASEVVADVTLGKKKWGSNELEIKSKRSAPIMREARLIDELKAGISQAFSEIAQKKAFLEGVEPVRREVVGRQLFARNCFYCVAYNKQCEYLKVCQVLDKKPAGFKVVKDVADYALDSIAES